MDRRTFLKSTSAAAAAATTGAAVSEQAAAAPQVLRQGEPIRTALSGPFQSGYLRDRADRLALRLREISDGRIRLEFVDVPGNAFTSVAQGAAEAYFGSEADHLEHDAGLAYVSALPGDLGLAPEQFATWLSAGGGQMMWDDLAAGFGVKALAAGHSGTKVGLWSSQDFTSLSELSGKRIATHGLAQRVARTIGAEAATLASADVVEPPMGPTAALSTPAVSRGYWFRDGFNRHGVALSFGLARQIWEGYSDSDRALINSCANEAYHQSLAEHTAHDQAVAPHLFTARKVVKRQLTDDVRHAITHVSHSVIADVAAQNASAARIHESYMQFREIVTGLPDPLRTAAGV